jgi:iron complex outermembrane receptor protein
VQPWGQPQSDAVRVFVNAGYQLDADTEFYGYGNYSDSSTDGNFFYRYPGNGVIESFESQMDPFTPLRNFSLAASLRSLMGM